MSPDTVVAGLVGSVGTVLVTKLLDLLQESQKHRNSLRHAYFERKLESAEIAAQQWQLYSTAYGVFDALAKRWESAPRNFSSSDIDLFGSAIWKQIVDLRTSSLNPSSSVRLYFESGNPDFWDSGPMKNLSHQFAALDVLQSRAHDMRGIYGPGMRVPAEMSESLVESFGAMQGEVTRYLKAIADSYNDLAKNASHVLKRVHAGMRKFDA